MSIAEVLTSQTKNFNPSQRFLEDFWRAWWGYGGRELGNPARIYMPSYPEDLPLWVRENEEAKRPCYLTVNRYSGPNQVCEISELFYDLDAHGDPPQLGLAWEEARGFAEALRRHYKAEALIAFSGRRGFHVHVPLKHPVQAWGLSQDHQRLLYRELAHMILRGLNYSHLDLAVVGDLKRTARIPYTRHEQTGLPCVPVDLGCRPVLLQSDTLVSIRERGLGEGFVQFAVQRVNREILGKALRRRFTSSIRYRNDDVRPCIAEALKRPLDDRGGHLMRLGVLREYQARGWSADSIVQLFSGQSDFREAKSRYYVEKAFKNPAGPFLCATIKSLGYCLGEACPIYRRRRHG